MGFSRGQFVITNKLKSSSPLHHMRAKTRLCVACKMSSKNSFKFATRQNSMKYKRAFITIHCRNQINAGLILFAAFIQCLIERLAVARVENLVAFVAFLVKSCDFQFSLSDKMRRAILCDLAKLEILT